MEFSTNELMEKIDSYFAGVTPKTDLGNWASKAYYDLLKGGYIENKKIVIYPFLKVISTFHLKENDKKDEYPCTEENVKIVQNILHGKIDFDFNIEMSIPIQTYTMFKENSFFDEERRDTFLEFREALVCCFEQGGAFGNEMERHLERVMHLEHQNKTVLGLLEEHIFKCLRVLFKIDSVEIGGQKNLKLYAKKTETNIIVKSLLDYLDCYVGNKNFQLLISFKNGVPSILVVV